MSQERDATVTIYGNPTTQEWAVITTAIWSITEETPMQSGASSKQHETLNSADMESAGASSADNTTRRLAHSRCCPRCSEKYDSAYRLDDTRQITTSTEGSSTICIGPSEEQIYVH